MPPRRPAELGVVGRRSAAATGAGAASTRPSARDVGPPAWHTPARPARAGLDRAGRQTTEWTPRARAGRPAAPGGMPPSRDQKSGGASSAGAGRRIGRSGAHQAPRLWAAASSRRETAAVDMSSTEPAWMPPISGSTRRSTTRRPSLRATSGPDRPVPDRAPAARAGGAARRGPGPAEPRSPRMPERADGQKRVGMPRASPAGRGRTARGPRPAPRRPHRDRARARPSSRQRSRPRGGGRGTRRGRDRPPVPE